MYIHENSYCTNYIPCNRATNTTHKSQIYNTNNTLKNGKKTKKRFLKKGQVEMKKEMAPIVGARGNPVWLETFPQVMRGQKISQPRVQKHVAYCYYYIQGRTGKSVHTLHLHILDNHQIYTWAA